MLPFLGRPARRTRPHPRGRTETVLSKGEPTLLVVAFLIERHCRRHSSRLAAGGTRAVASSNSTRTTSLRLDGDVDGVENFERRVKAVTELHTKTVLTRFKFDHGFGGARSNVQM